MSDLPKPRMRLDFLDVARGCAATLIMVEHGLHTCVPGYLQFSLDNVILAQAGVLMFFIISGFVIPMSLETVRSSGSFWLRRCFRLFPVYWFTIGLGFLLMSNGRTTDSLFRFDDTDTWLANAAMLQNVFSLPNIWGVYWTLPYEFRIYIVCGLLYSLGLLQRIGPRTLVVMFVAFAAYSLGRPLLKGKPLFLLIGTQEMVISIGPILGFVAHRYVSGRVSRKLFYRLLAGMVSLVLLVWAANLARVPSMRDPKMTILLARCAIIWTLTVGAFLCLIELRHRSMPRVLSWLGVRSYSIYLLHPFVLVFLTPSGWPFWTFMPALLGTTILLATLSHRWIELPGIALGRRIEKRLIRDRASVPAVPLAAPVDAPISRAA